MNSQNEKTKRYKKKSDEESFLHWFASVFILTFILSLSMSYLSSEAIKDLNIFLAIPVLIFIIFIGIFFDIIGVAVTLANEHEFHAKASKKLKGSKTAIGLIRNSHKVSSFCADVIGDISGVLSGAISAIIAYKITSSLNLDFNLQFLISAIVASLTVGGKAIGKIIARKYTTSIVLNISKFFEIIKRK